MDRIIVYLLTDEPNNQRVKLVDSLFSEELFQVKVITIDPLPDTDHEHIANEINRFKWCLHDAAIHHVKNHIIIIKDTSISNATPITVAEIIRSAITTLRETKIPLCYLCKWHDRCELYKDKKQVLHKSTFIVKSYSPHGVQALLISPDGRDILLGKRALKDGKYFDIHQKSLSVHLNEQIVKGNLEATCTYPNLIQFDISASKTEADHIKTQECIFENQATQTTLSKIVTASELQQLNEQINQARDNEMLLWTFVLVVLIVLIIVWLVAIYGRNSGF